MRIRADFAARGYSLEKDLGNRLRFIDALALYEMMLTDPRTYTGASTLGARIPMTVTDIILQSMFANNSLLTAHSDSSTSYVPSDEEIAFAENAMSSLFTNRKE